MDKKMLEQYARLIVETGVNVQKNQPVMINCPIEGAEFGRLLAKAAYDCGASEVVFNWRDDTLTRLFYLHGEDSLFDITRSWDADKYNKLAEMNACCISVSGSDPECLKGVDPERIRRRDNAVGRDYKPFYRSMTNNENAWCVASVPVPAWAKRVFPELSEDEAIERLWGEIFKSVRITEGKDAVSEWKNHCATLKKHVEKMNGYNFKFLRYTNSLGTDLTVEMPENHVWQAGGDTTPRGVAFNANMPTEEVFCAPKRDGVNGVLYAALPLVLNGNLVTGIRFKFENGRIVDVKADTCEDVLKKAVDTDEGSHYLGEIALVPNDSPISNSKILFYNTLFDENASCHFAFGEAYPSSIKGGEKMELDELWERGINAESNTHIDFMVGTADLSIVGTTHDGKMIDVFKNGNFAF